MLTEWYSAPPLNGFSSYYYYPEFGGNLVRIRLELNRGSEVDGGNPCIIVTPHTVVGFAHTNTVGWYYYGHWYFYCDVNKGVMYALKKISLFTNEDLTVLVKGIGIYDEVKLANVIAKIGVNFEFRNEMVAYLENTFKPDYIPHISNDNIYALSNVPIPEQGFCTIDYTKSNNGIQRDFVHTGYQAITAGPIFPVYRKDNTEIPVTVEHLKIIAQNANEDVDLGTSGMSENELAVELLRRAGVRIPDESGYYEYSNTPDTPDIPDDSSYYEY